MRGIIAYCTGKISNDSESTTTSATPSSTSLTNIAGMDQSQLLEFLSACEIVVDYSLRQGIICFVSEDAWLLKI